MLLEAYWRNWSIEAIEEDEERDGYKDGESAAWFGHVDTSHIWYSNYLYRLNHSR